MRCLQKRLWLGPHAIAQKIIKNLQSIQKISSAAAYLALDNQHKASANPAVGPGRPSCGLCGLTTLTSNWSVLKKQKEHVQHGNSIHIYIYIYINNMYMHIISIYIYTYMHPSSICPLSTPLSRSFDVDSTATGSSPARTRGCSSPRAPPKAPARSSPPPRPRHRQNSAPGTAAAPRRARSTRRGRSGRPPPRPGARPLAGEWSSVLGCCTDPARKVVHFLGGLVRKTPFFFPKS